MLNRKLHVLFAMHYPGYLRYYDSTIRELAERGHQVSVVFESPRKQAEGLKALVPPPDGVEVLPGFPKRGDALEFPARAVRRTTDYVRYLHPYFRDAQHLRRRLEFKLPLPARMLTRLPTLPAPLARWLIRAMLAVERSIPSSSVVEKFIRGLAPDVVVVTPLVALASRETDLVKSARALGIPSVLGVASWDHLTSKGLIRVMPDKVVLWNDAQRQEAIELHDVAAEDIVVTGAQPWDRWFDRRPALDREAFCRRVGLSGKRPFVLFVGSTASISHPDAEQQFVKEWISAIRTSEHPALRDAAVLVRPHPYNPGTWADADMSGLGDVAVWPSAGANPVDEDNRDDYFHSMYYAEAVVGINTSAMIESAILGRAVHTIQADDFSDTQGGTVHFRYLLPENGGVLVVARSLDEHIDQLAESLRDPAAVAERNRRFIGSFVRPHGLDVSGTPLVADAIEAAAVAPARAPLAVSPLLAPVRIALTVAGLGVFSKQRATRAKGLRKVAGHVRARLPLYRPSLLGGARK